MTEVMEYPLVISYPRGFVPDLRRLRPWPTLEGSLWRNPDLVELTYQRLSLLVQALIGTKPRQVLYVGCGLGHIALELARAGHDVTGVEIDADAIALAHRAARTDPWCQQRGDLSYLHGGFPDAVSSDQRYDRVLFCRVLHHLEDPAFAIERARQVLGPGGKVVCVEFSYDRLGAGGARFLAQSRMRLADSGRWPSPTGSSLEEELRRVWKECRDDHAAEGLNPHRAMLGPLRWQFHLSRLAWHPYIFWELAASMKVAPEHERAEALQLRDDEVDQLRGRRQHGVLFSATGTPLSQNAEINHPPSAR
jgi:SAM-dependent methyltransferase